MSDIRLEDIDWNSLWQKKWEERNRKVKNAEDWDRKAEAFARRNAHSVYNDAFIAMLDPQSSWSVLDVGSGPGTLAIPLARRVRRVTALDFSPRMLAILTKRKAEQGLTNIGTINLSWTDDWQEHGLPVHDVVIASRSLAARDLRSALEKLSCHARQAVIVSDRVGPGPFDPDAFAAVGRELRPGPDYIYTINLLYRMGIHARLDFIALENAHRYSSMAEAVDNYSWMFSDLTAPETKRLEKYVRSIAVPDREIITLKPRHVTTWAFIRWSPSGGVVEC